MTKGRSPAPEAAAWRPFPTLAQARPGADVLAGISLAAVAIPEQLATGRLAGLEPASGLIAFAAATLAFAALGRSPCLSVGADSTISPVIAGAIAGSAAAAAGAESSAAVLAVMVGILLILVRILRLGWLADLLSAPVGAGLMAGIAAHIVVGRLPSLLNLNIPMLSMGETLLRLARDRGTADPLPLALGLAVALCCALGHRFAPRWPVALAAVAAAASFAALVDPEGVRFPRAGPVSGGLAWFPDGLRDAGTFVALIPAALTITFLCITQTAAIEKVDAPRTVGAFGPWRDRMTGEIGALGAANVLAGLAGAFAVNSSPPRTAVAAAAGARSQLASIVAAALALAVLFGAGGLLEALPVAALSGVLLFVAGRIFPAHLLAHIFRHSPDELILAISAALLVIVLPVQTGAAMALLLGILHAAQASLRPQAGELLRVPGTTVWWRARADEYGERVPGVLVLGIGAPLNFITTPRILETLDEALAAQRKASKIVVLEAAGVLAVDITAADLLARRIAEMRNAGLEVAIARLEAARGAHEAEATGLIAAVGPDKIFLTVEEAVRQLASAPVNSGNRTGSGANDARQPHG
ncbi:SulP family inorganic anion transporter [Zhengella sp. ZM62]|uniref:SulP family inorganic anion transporter n=1 Tax=Zhengella sedimenti TaxID=3390035 RepID=UPI003974735F